ncbi:MAG: DNA polymerase III subunit delta' [Alphaproteobacteria bacterium]
MYPSVPTARDNPNLVGHEAAERRLLEEWTTGRLAHAWLIGGPRGIGKATLAYRFARFVLAGGGSSDAGLFGSSLDTLALSPDHPVFRRVASGGHADFLSVERGWADEKRSKRRKEIVVEDVREIGAFLSLTPAEGGWRVVLIDAADEMNRNAANALLKILEEPPRRSLLLLVCHNPGSLLPTIRSRCRFLKMRPLPLPAVMELLRRYRPDLPEADLAPLAILGEGSFGRSLDLAESGGLALYGEIIGLLRGAPGIDVGRLYAFSDRVGKTETESRATMELLGWWLARLIRQAARGSPEQEEVVEGESALAERFSRACSLDQWVEVWEKVTHLFARGDAVNLDQKQVIRSAILMIEKVVRA